MIYIYFAPALSIGLSVTTDLRLRLVKPVYEMQFELLYLSGLNELVGLAYVQNLVLLMKRSRMRSTKQIQDWLQLCNVLRLQTKCTPLFG